MELTSGDYQMVDSTKSSPAQEERKSTADQPGTIDRGFGPRHNTHLHDGRQQLMEVPIEPSLQPLNGGRLLSLFEQPQTQTRGQGLSPDGPVRGSITQPYNHDGRLPLMYVNAPNPLHNYGLPRRLIGRGPAHSQPLPWLTAKWALQAAGPYASLQSPHPVLHPASDVLCPTGTLAVNHGYRPVLPVSPSHAPQMFAHNAHTLLRSPYHVLLSTSGILRPTGTLAINHSYRPMLPVSQSHAPQMFSTQRPHLDTNNSQYIEHYEDQSSLDAEQTTTASAYIPSQFTYQPLAAESPQVRECTNALLSRAHDIRRQARTHMPAKRNQDRVAKKTVLKFDSGEQRRRLEVAEALLMLNAHEVVFPETLKRYEGNRGAAAVEAVGAQNMPFSRNGRISDENLDIEHVNAGKWRPVCGGGQKPSAHAEGYLLMVIVCIVGPCWLTLRLMFQS
jgi:hypothetical protein